MVWSRVILDGICMSLIFNLLVGLMWVLTPTTFSQMLPKGIRARTPKRTKKEKIILASWLYPTYICMFVYIAISTHLSGTTGVWNYFWSGYIIMFFVNLGDFFGLDWFFRSKVKEKIMIPGTEECKEWNTKEWMFSLGLVEHWILWPFIVCPLVGLITVGLCSL